MTDNGVPVQPRRCSFCGLPQDRTEILVSGIGVLICGACIELCAEVLADYRAGKAPEPAILLTGGSPRA